MGDELKELKDRLADLGSAVDELVARQKAQLADQQAEADQPPQPPPSTPEP